MLTPGEIAAINGALDAARAELARLEAVAETEDAARLPVWRWLVPGPARKTATTAAALIASVEQVRDGLIEAPEDDHEEALHAVQLARELAEPGWTARAIHDATLGDAIDNGDAWQAAKDALKRAVGNFIPWWVWVLGVAALFLLLAPTFAAVAALFRGRR